MDNNMQQPMQPEQPNVQPVQPTPQPVQQPMQQPQYQQPMQQPTEGKNANAVTALVLGIVSIVLSFFGYLSLVGLICGIIGIVQATKGRKIPFKKGMATAGLVLSIIGVVFCGLTATCLICAMAAIGSIASAM